MVFAILSWKAFYEAPESPKIKLGYYIEYFNWVVQISKYLTCFLIFLSSVEVQIIGIHWRVISRICSLILVIIQALKSSYISIYYAEYHKIYEEIFHCDIKKKEEVRS